jgi:cytochrome b involved in lipid metabolism
MIRFLEDHPGGAKAILLYAGREATEEFEMVHPANTLEKHAKHIGTSYLLLPCFQGSILISSHW